MATPAESAEPGHFQLVILHATWESMLNHLYDQEHVWAVLRNTDLSKPSYVITDQDVLKYDWKEQSLLLDVPTSQDILNRFAEPPTFVGLADRCFIVVLDGERIYGGIITNRGNPLALRFPVIFADSTSAGVVLTVRPVNTSAAYGSIPAELKTTIELPSIHDYFASVGKLA